jgi:cytochrome c peroxidase
MDYLLLNYGEGYTAPEDGKLLPLPVKSKTFDPSRPVPVKLPPGSNLNKQLPRPRQILNMATRGVDESETPLIALGDMAFDSPHIFGEPARSLAISCNTCHNKGVTNPNFMIPGLSSVAGGLDVSSVVFAPHANNGVFDPLDIPDLRGIRFTAPYGRNGRFASLRDFVRNVIVNEFNGPEPDPVILDGMIAYMLEFDFLPNPDLNADGTLSGEAPEAARRGEKLFNKPFAQMNGRSCATCHVPSNHFIDGMRHDIGSVRRSEEYARDGALDTPTLLSAKFTAPYFHDGSLPTLRAVVEWFNDNFKLDLAKQELADLTAYIETVGDGVDGMEDTIHTLEAEMEEFSFFLSSYEFLKRANKPGPINALFQTVEQEIHAHKWDVQDLAQLPVLDQLASLMGEAYEANVAGDRERVDRIVAEYRALYEEHAENLK